MSEKETKMLERANLSEKMEKLYNYLRPKTKDPLGMSVYNKWIDGKSVQVINILHVNMDEVDLDYIQNNIGDYEIIREIKPIRTFHRRDPLSYEEKKRYIYIKER